MKKFLLIFSLLMCVTVSPMPPCGANSRSEDTNRSDRETFPVTIDFQCPRNFGFHIGDEIPLTVTFTARKGVILDLVNLPQENDSHGPFEVRNRSVHTRLEDGQTVYTVFYRLQCFAPAIAVDRVQFPPLQIPWATQEDWDPMESKYRYRTLFSQPHEIFVSRTATYAGGMRDIKGPIPDRKAILLWKMALVGGGIMVIAALITWPWNFIRRRRETTQAQPCITARDRALKALREARENCFNYDDHRKRLYFELNAILRNFLKEVFVLPVANRPSAEVVSQLKERPEYEELLDLVRRINRVLYEGSPPVDVESIVRQFNGLLERLDRSVPSGVNHDQTG